MDIFGRWKTIETIHQILVLASECNLELTSIYPICVLLGYTVCGQPPTTKNRCLVYQQPSLLTTGAVWSSDSALVRRCAPPRGLGRKVVDMWYLNVFNLKMTISHLPVFVHVQVLQTTSRKGSHCISGLSHHSYILSEIGWIPMQAIALYSSLNLQRPWPYCPALLRRTTWHPSMVCMCHGNWELIHHFWGIIISPSDARPMRLPWVIMMVTYGSYANHSWQPINKIQNFKEIPL